MRNFRLDDDVYAAAQERARREFTTVTAVIERFLRAYTSPAGSVNVNDVARQQEAHEREGNAVLGYSKERQTRGRR